jgi:cardiolipin synthase
MFTDHLPQLIAAAYALLELGGIAAAVHAVMHARTSQGAIAWAIALLAVPWLALPLYGIFGSSKFYGYVHARRTGELAIQHVTKALAAKHAPVLKAAFAPGETRHQAFERLAKMPFTHGNRVELLVNGEATFGAILEGIAAAREYLLVQFYIVRDDDLGARLKQALTERLRHGVRVYFLYDAVGSYDLPEGYPQSLRDAGAEVHGLSGSNRKIKRLQINFRNHRKIVVVDGHTAFLGGLNVGDEYLGKAPKFSPWRDTHVRVTGPAATAVQLAFLEDWYWAAHEVPTWNWEPRRSEGDQRVLVLPSGPADDLETCGLFFVHAINSARRRCWIVSPYFVPDEAVLDALQLAALRGVDVRIILPAKPDHRIVHLASLSYLPETIGVGIRVFRYHNGFLHQKVMLVDDDLATVGTANFDNRSFRLNFEITVVVIDHAFAAAVAGMLEADLAHCREITVEDYARRNRGGRVIVSIARLLAPVL